MKRKNDKGFTIVELVIVIAVIAILAAVLIPTFSSIVKKAKVSNDTQLVKNLNTALAADTDSHKTMSDALDAAAEFGYDVAKINASATDNEILWDSVNDVFCYLNDGNITYIPDSKEKDVKDYQLWKIYNSASEVPTAQKYSIYWNTDETIVPELKVGFDAGKYATDLDLKYVGSGEAQDVIIRTNGGTLTIDAANDTVRHYGNAAMVNVNAIAGESYHAHGTVGVITITKGHVVVENGATVSTVTKSNGATDVSVTNNGTVAASVDVEVSGTAPATEVKSGDIKSTLTAEGGYVKLSDNQEIKESITLTKDTILDLNGKTITFSDNKTGYALGVNNVNLTIMDSSADQNGTMTFDDNVYTKLIDVTDGSLTINGGNFSNQRTLDGNNIAIITANKGATVIINGGIFTAKANENRKENKSANVLYYRESSRCYINGGTFISEGNSVFAGNGTDKNWGTYMEINGGTLKSNADVVLYHPQVGTLNINGGYLEGATVVYQKSGTMNITGGTFKATGDYTAYNYNGNGANATGDAIVIDSCKGYQTPYANITLSDTKISVKDSNCKKVAGYVQTTYEGKPLENSLFIVWNGEEVRAIEVK